MREIDLTVSRLNVAKKLMKLRLMQGGVKLSTVKADELTAAARQLIEQEPEYVEYAFRLMLP